MKSCWVKLKDGTQFGGILWKLDIQASLIDIAAIKLADGNIGKRSVSLNDIIYGECEVSYAKQARDKLGYSQALVPILAEARRCGWKPDESFDGKLSFSLKELIDKDIDSKDIAIGINDIRVIEQHNGQLHGYIDIPIGLARRLGLIDI